MRLLLISVLAALALPTAARACGGIFVPEESDAAARFDTQSVFIHRRADRVDHHLRMTVAPGATDVAWVIPAPADATLALGDDALFESLDDLTRPVISIEHVGGNGGCSAGDAAGTAPGGDLDIRDIGQIGEYDYAIIATGDAAAAATWLTDNGYAIPDGAADAMQPYADAGLAFIGVRLARPDPELARPTPLIVSTPDATADLPLYPLALSRIGAADTLPVLIWVLGPDRAAVGDVDTATVGDIADLIRERRYLSYADATDLRQSETDAPLWITDAVVLDPTLTRDGARLDGAVLTRLSARLPRDLIHDVRLVAHPDATAIDPYQHRTVGDPDDGCAATGARAPIWAVILLFGAARLRRRRT